MEGVKKTRGCQFFSLKVGLVLAIVFIFGGAFYYNHHVILYRNQLNLLVSYLYDEVSPNQVGAVYQRMLNIDSDYRERIKNDLEPAMISRYQYYANLYMLRKIEYEEYLQYEQVIEPLFFSNDKVIEIIAEVEKYYQSQRAYLKGFNLQQQGLIEEAIDSYQEVMFNDEYYYELAKMQRRECIQSIKNQYLTEAHEYYEQKNYIEAIRRLDYLTQTDKDESVSALKWYYESEFYVEAIKTIDEFLAKDELASAISYLEQISDSFGTQYAETLELKKSEISLQRIKRRDKVMSKYAAKIQVNLNAENGHQIISYNGIPLQATTSFNVISFATNTFTTVKKEVDESVEEEQVEQYINVMPLLVTNSELTSATMSILLGYYSEFLNDFEQVDIYAENQLLYSFDIDSTQKQQVWIDDRVIEWSEVELSTQAVYELLNEVQATTSLSIVFRGPLMNHSFELELVENATLIMMADIYQSINK